MFTLGVILEVVANVALAKLGAGIGAGLAAIGAGIGQVLAVSEVEQ